MGGYATRDRVTDLRLKCCMGIISWSQEPRRLRSYHSFLSEMAKSNKDVSRCLGGQNKEILAVTYYVGPV